MTKPRSTPRYEPKPFVNINLGGERIRLEAFGWSKLTYALDLVKPAVLALTAGTDRMVVALQFPEVLTELACMATKRDATWFEEKDISTEELVELMAVIYALNEPELKKLKPRPLTPQATPAKQEPGSLLPLMRSLRNSSPLVR